ncbi:MULTISPECIES: hypothetical protein [Haloarcula]|uniref:hypothetical protein n=1 Tax=Haloarcula TaxID=2237 RepID=UPI0023EBA7A1|nr:hypothetical protein [Halomicroarcula sp. XH51]
MRRWLVHATVLVLVASAGCSAVFESTPDRATVTPVAVPTVETPLAPGVPAAADGESRTVETDRLRRADRRVRNASSYRLDRTVVIDGPDGQVRIERERRTQPDGAAAEHLSTSTTGLFSPAVVESALWTDGTVFWSRTRLADGETIVNRRHPEPPSFHSLGPALPGRLLDAADYRVLRAGEEGVVLRSTTPVRLTWPAVPVVLVDRRNGSAWLTVRRDGLVVDVVFRYPATFDDDPVLVTVRQRVSAVNETTVDRPAWADGDRTPTPEGA